MDSSSTAAQQTSAAPAPPPRFWTAANVLTLSRFAFAAAFLAVYQLTGAEPMTAYWDGAHIGLVACLAIVLLAECTDFFDGVLARRLGQVSDFGKLMDPYADSVYRLTCFFCFASAAHGSWIPIWMVLILLYRDIASSVTRVFALRQGIVVAARTSGKIKAWVQALTMIALLVMAALRYEWPVRIGTGRALMWIAVAVAIWSGIDYLWANRKVFRV